MDHTPGGRQADDRQITGSFGSRSFSCSTAAGCLRIVKQDGKNMPKFLLVPNPIGRYSIGDRTPVLQVAADGSVTIYLQKDSPGPDKESNWLPAPEGDFRPAMRMYQPSPEILKGDYLLPPITEIS